MTNALIVLRVTVSGSDYVSYILWRDSELRVLAIEIILFSTQTGRLVAPSGKAK
jgi:hypothetical protein